MRRGRICLLAAVAALCLLTAPAAQAQGDGSPDPRIVGGSAASISTYPWQAAVVFSPAKVSGNAHGRQFCGGSLLTSRIVITAGHCVYDTDPDPGCFFCTPAQLRLDADDVDVVLGRTTLSNTSEGGEYPVIGVGLQGGYFIASGGAPNNDVGYLVLGTAPGAPEIKIAGPDEGSLWDAGSPAEISGWGTTSSGGNTQDTLRAATVTINSDATCGSIYPGDFNASNMLCGGASGVDTCQGDSGGPLQAPVSGGGYRLVGLTSWGIGCGQRPGVYSRVAGASLSSAIQAQVNALNAQFGLPAEGIFGGSVRAVDQPPAAPATAPTKARANPFAKCKRIKKKRKRHRCIKKVKRKLRAKHKRKHRHKR